jgi:hypothetical protein
VRPLCQRNCNPEHASHRGRTLYLREASPPRFSQEFVTISKAKRMVNAAAAYQTERGFERQISASVSKASKPADQQLRVIARRSFISCKRFDHARYRRPSLDCLSLAPLCCLGLRSLPSGHHARAAVFSRL